LSTFLIGTALAGSGTDYSVQGSNWEGTCADGERQSPIAIQSTTIDPDDVEFTWDAFQPSKYDMEREWTTSIGDSIKLTPTSEENPITVKGGYLPEGNYILAQFHMHWGDDVRGGSEHTLDDKRYFSEVHLVHYKEEYGTIGDSLDKGDGLAVLGFFIETGAEEETNLDRILNQALDAGDGANVSFELGEMVNDDFDEFFRYEGSLTTPTCNEAVQWTVFRRPLKITDATKEKMLAGTTLDNNFRVTMPLNDRKVKFYHNDINFSSSPVNMASVMLATCAVYLNL